MLYRYKHYVLKWWYQNDIFIANKQITQHKKKEKYTQMFMNENVNNKNI